MADAAPVATQTPAARPAPPPAAPAKGPPPKAAPPAAKPAAAPPKEAAPAAKPSVTDREREERVRALAQATKIRQDRDALQGRLSEMEKALAEAKGGGAKELADIKRLLREDPHAAFKALEADLPTVTRGLLAKAGKGDPKDAEREEMRRELADLKKWREDQSEGEKRRAETEARAAQEQTSTQIFGVVLRAVEDALEPWKDATPEDPKALEAAYGDELFLADLKEDPAGWRSRLRAYAEKYPNKSEDDARRFYAGVLLQRQRSRAKLRFVGALTGDSASDDAPTSETGGRPRADVPRRSTRKSSADASATKTIPVSGLSLRERDELKQARRRELAARVGR